MAKAAEHARQTQANRDAARRATPEAQRAQRIREGVSAASRDAAARRGGKPSYRTAAAQGAASGAAAGPEGALAGAALGIAQTRGKKKEAAKLKRAMRSPARKVLVAEYILCMIILAFSPLTDKHGTDTAVKWMKRGTAMSVVFLLLGIISSGGPRAEKVAAAAGGLITVALAMNDRDIFATMATRLSGSAATTTATGPHGAENTDRSGAG